MDFQARHSRLSVVPPYSSFPALDTFLLSLSSSPLPFSSASVGPSGLSWLPHVQSSGAWASPPLPWGCPELLSKRQCFALRVSTTLLNIFHITFHILPCVMIFISMSSAFSEININTCWMKGLMCCFGITDFYLAASIIGLQGLNSRTHLVHKYNSINQHVGSQSDLAPDEVLSE